MRVIRRILAEARLSAVAMFAAVILCPNVASAWEPSKFELFCGSPSTEPFRDAKGVVLRPGTLAFYGKQFGVEADIADDPGCLSPERAELAASYAEIALKFFQSLGFASPAPNRLGPVVEGADGEARVRFYAVKDYASIANTRSPCQEDGSAVDPEWLSIMRFNPYFINDLPPPRALHIIAHEVFHLVQNAQIYINSPETNDCARIGQWLTEGLADAMGMEVTRQRFPNYRPSLNVLGALSFYGLRPYNRAFVWTDLSTRDTFGNAIIPHYRTASFWEYLADHYYGGSFAYVADYLAVPNLALGRDDWLDWLDGLLRSRDPGVEYPFYLVFPDFLANYAMWGKERFPNIGETEWLNRAFGGCETITLTPQQSNRGLALDLEMISGRCLRVIVGGLASGDLAQVKFMAYGSSVDELDSLHIATASLSAPWVDTPGMETNCYRIERDQPGRPGCIIKPYIGRREGQAESWVRTWSPSRQSTDTGTIENLYIIAHTPPSPQDLQHGADEPAMTVRLSVGLDYSSMKTDATGRANKSTAAANGSNTDNLPMKGTGNGAGQLGAVVAGLAQGPLGASLGELSGMAFLVDAPSQLEVQEAGLSMVEFAANEIASGGQLSATHRLVLQLTDGPIPFDSPGKYSAIVTLTDEKAVDNIQNLESPTSPSEVEAFGNLIAGLVNKGVMGGGGPSGSATLEIVTYNEKALHVRARGAYCHLADADRQTGSCRNPQHFEAEMLTPFGWAWDPAQSLVSENTPGIELYRQELEDQVGGIVVASSLGPVFIAPEPQVDELPQSDDAACSCTCDDFQRFIALGPLMAAPETSAAALEEMFSKQQCPLLCQSQWLTCNR